MATPIVGETGTLKDAPRKFFMTLRDIAFWINSARTDSELAKLEQQHGVGKALDMLYERHADPWGATLDCYRYQHLKYDRLIAMLPDRRYGSVLDVGCGLGVFTRRLAAYADDVLGVEVSQAAVRRAQALSADIPNVRFQQGCVLELEQYVTGTFDLIIITDTLYYLAPLSEEVMGATVAMVERLLKPGGILLLADHYFVQFDPGSRASRQIKEAFHGAASLRPVRARWRPFYLASVLEKKQP